MRQQKVRHKKRPVQVPVIDNRKISVQKVDLSQANQPVRTVHLVEMREMTPSQMKVFMDKLADVQSKSTDGIHFVLPVRDGKIGSDILFEQEWESLVQRMFEVDQTGKIVLKGGAKETQVIRQIHQ